MTQLHQSAMGLVNSLEARQRLGLMKQEEDRRARLSDLQMRGLQREEDYQTGLQNAMSNPGTMPAQSVTGFTPAPEQNFTPAPDSLASLFPQQNQMQPQVGAIEVPKSRLQSGREFAESKGRFEDVGKIVNLDDALAQYGAKVQNGGGDIQKFYKNKQELDTYKQFISEVSPLLKTAAGRQVAQNVAAKYAATYPDDKGVFDISTINVAPEGNVVNVLKTPDGKPAGMIITMPDGSTHFEKPVAENDDVTARVVKDAKSPTGWSYVDKAGKNVVGAPDPYISRTNPSAQSNNNESGFQFWATKLQTLQGKISSIEKGVDPLTGAVIPQTNIQNALATLRPEIENTKRYMKKKYPNEYTTYFGAEQQAQPAGKVLDEKTATDILRDAGGDKDKARQMARGLGFTL